MVEVLISLSYHNQALKYFADKDEGKIYLAELLLKLKGKGDEAEARALVEKVAQSDDRYFREWATRLLAKIK